MLITRPNDIGCRPDLAVFELELVEHLVVDNSERDRSDQFRSRLVAHGPDDRHIGVRAGCRALGVSTPRAAPTVLQWSGSSRAPQARPEGPLPT